MSTEVLFFVIMFTPLVGFASFVGFGWAMYRIGWDNGFSERGKEIDE